MTYRKRTPYFFLGLLLLVLLFILGVRYGQYVEKANRLAGSLANVAPSATSAPLTDPLTFRTYRHIPCGVQFLLPASFITVKEGSEGAMLQDGGTIKISLECNKQSPTAQASPSQTFTFQKKLVPVREAGSLYIFTLRNPYNDRSLVFSVEKTFFPLLEKSLEMIQ